VLGRIGCMPDTGLRRKLSVWDLGTLWAAVGSWELAEFPSSALGSETGPGNSGPFPAVFSKSKEETPL
jgi:hypothetical protein